MKSSWFCCCVESNISNSKIIVKHFHGTSTITQIKQTLHCFKFLSLISTGFLFSGTFQNNPLHVLHFVVKASSTPTIIHFKFSQNPLEKSKFIVCSGKVTEPKGFWKYWNVCHSRCRHIPKLFGQNHVSPRWRWIVGRQRFRHQTVMEVLS